ncbi:hypothetical protein [Streptomyces spiramyceticus]|uniref:hypothetical protein n=2 Tax=Streptomyces spiramyceticus TaxID=299717 RepID=UPI00237BDAAB|nr:hypothetical protein [Streptomyces spiramyceticus]
MNLRMIGLAAVVVFTVLLPLAGAAAEPDPVPLLAPLIDDAKASPAAGPRPESAQPSHSSQPLQPSPVQCGPELTSPEGIEVQTCVLTEGVSTWARAYYRNASGEELRSVLSLMGPGGRALQMHCKVRADDEPGVCETPREPTRGKAALYTAVAEFAAAGNGPLLLRSGSNSAAPAAR